MLSQKSSYAEMFQGKGPLVWCNQINQNQNNPHGSVGYMPPLMMVCAELYRHQNVWHTASSSTFIKLNSSLSRGKNCPHMDGIAFIDCKEHGCNPRQRTILHNNSWSCPAWTTATRSASKPVQRITSAAARLVFNRTQILPCDLFRLQPNPT